MHNSYCTSWGQQRIDFTFHIYSTVKYKVDTLSFSCSTRNIFELHCSLQQFKEPKVEDNILDMVYVLSKHFVLLCRILFYNYIYTICSVFILRNWHMFIITLHDIYSFPTLCPSSFPKLPSHLHKIYLADISFIFPFKLFTFMVSHVRGTK